MIVFLKRAEKFGWDTSEALPHLFLSLTRYFLQVFGIQIDCNKTQPC